jgi:hypothetical protein
MVEAEGEYGGIDPEISKTILGYERKRNDHDSYSMVLAFTLIGYVHNWWLFDWVGDDYPQ